MRVAISLTVSTMIAGSLQVKTLVVVATASTLAYAMASSLAGIAKHQLSIDMRPETKPHTWINDMLSREDQILILSSGESKDGKSSASILMRPDIKRANHAK